MSQQPGQHQGLLDSLQSEVAPEASPLLNFLMKHTRIIILAFVLIVVAIGGYMYYSHKTHTASLSQQQELGKILVIADPVARLTGLENYLIGAPASLKNQTMLAIIQSAMELNNTGKVLEMWERLGKEDKNFSYLSAIGTASALADTGKYAEAMTIYEGLLPQAAVSERPLINRSILNYAEILGDTKRAIQACEALLAEQPAMGLSADESKVLEADRALLTQKLAMLRLKAE